MLRAGVDFTQLLRIILPHNLEWVNRPDRGICWNHWIETSLDLDKDRYARC